MEMGIQIGGRVTPAKSQVTMFEKRRCSHYQQKLENRLAKINQKKKTCTGERPGQVFFQGRMAVGNYKLCSFLSTSTTSGETFKLLAMVETRLFFSSMATISGSFAS